MGMDRERRRMKKPFFDHLKELNNRILFSLLLILIFGIYVYIEYHFFVEISIHIAVLFRHEKHAKKNYNHDMFLLT